MNHSTKIPGIDFDFGGGRVFALAPLTLGTLENMQAKLADLSVIDAMQPASIATIVDATHSSLQRNYPQITRAEVGELVDVGNMYEVIACVLDVAGLKRKAEAEAKNAQAQAAPALQPTGQPSLPTSAPTPAGPGPTSEST